MRWSNIVANLKHGNNQTQSAILPSIKHIFQTATTGAKDE
jgi:hypothetical protein